MFLKDNRLKVLEVFLKNPDENIHHRELSRRVGISASGLLKILAKLKKEDLIKIEKGNVLNIITASKTKEFYYLKRAYNLYSVYASGVVEQLADLYEEPEAIVLFGSFGKGEDAGKSDIDIAIITKKRISPDLRRFENVLGKHIHLVEIDIRQAEKAFINSLANGIVLKGNLEVIR